MWGISSYTAPNLHVPQSLSDWKEINIKTIIRDENIKIYILTFFKIKK